MSDDFDTLMYRLAAARGRVLVTLPGRRPRTATLVAWRPIYRRRRTYGARVDYGLGPLTVSARYVEPADPPVNPQAQPETVTA